MRPSRCIRLFFNGMFPCLLMYSSSVIRWPFTHTMSPHWSP
ncbi:hypothetical protein EVA_05015 [gut metagenome]|uniref:Uncharacterized protein n=1 Tax=gut metagenome TaxID=749906 RepID=J9D2M1_9ZZZZ